MKKLADWLDHRTGFRFLRHHALDEPLPPGTGWWFTLGSLLLFGLTIQVVTGIALAMYYAPTPDHAWDSVRYITNEVRGGSFLRGLHHWGASLVVVAAILHLIRVVIFGSYRKPREVNWLIGLVLLLIILAFGLTGYLLPWDQRAYWATVVAINVSSLTPVVGDFVANLLRGGSEIGALTLTRWYSAHVLLLPLALLSLVIAHLYLMRRHGISGPIRPQPGGRSQMFYPYQATRDLTVALLAGVVLIALALTGAPALEPPADPTAGDYVPRPDWYFFGLFELLKYFPGKWEVVGALIIPGLAVTFLALLPWIDRGKSREIRHRLPVILPFAAGLVLIVALTVRGARDTPGTAGNRPWSIREIAGASLAQTSDRCIRCHKPDGAAAPIEAGAIRQTAAWLAAHVADPEIIAPGVREAPQTNQAETHTITVGLARLRTGPPPTVAPDTLVVYRLYGRFCVSCHVIDGLGGKDGPDLSHVGTKLTLATIEQRIIDPLVVDPIAEMPAFGEKLTADEIRRLAVWLSERK